MATGSEEGSRHPGPDSDRRAAVAALAELGGLMIRLRRRDVSLSAEAVLINLDRAGPGRVGDLAALVGVSQPTMTELLGRLERDGWVVRDTHPGDRRAVQVSITEAGGQFLRLRREKTYETLLELVDDLASAEAVALAAAVPALEAVLLASARRTGRDAPDLPKS